MLAWFGPHHMPKLRNGDEVGEKKVGNRRGKNEKQKLLGATSEDFVKRPRRQIQGTPTRPVSLEESLDPPKKRDRERLFADKPNRTIPGRKGL